MLSNTMEISNIPLWRITCKKVKLNGHIYSKMCPLLFSRGNYHFYLPFIYHNKLYVLKLDNSQNIDFLKILCIYDTNKMGGVQEYWYIWKCKFL